MSDEEVEANGRHWDEVVAVHVARSQTLKAREIQFIQTVSSG